MGALNFWGRVRSHNLHVLEDAPGALNEPSALVASPRSTSLWYTAATNAPISGPIQNIHCVYHIHGRLISSGKLDILSNGYEDISKFSC
jgi:hypothetical protein